MVIKIIRAVPISLMTPLLILLVSLNVSELKAKGLNVIPYPQQVSTGGEDFIINGKISIELDRNAGNADRFTAEELIRDLKNKYNIQAQVGQDGTGQGISHFAGPICPSSYMTNNYWTWRVISKNSRLILSFSNSTAINKSLYGKKRGRHKCIEF